MKFLKAILAIVGLVGLIAAAVFLFQSWIDIRSLVAVANANKNEGAAIASPFPKVGLAAGLAAFGALILGLGAGLPRITEGGIRRHILEAQHDNTRRGLDRAATEPARPRRGDARETVVTEERTVRRDAHGRTGSSGAATAERQERDDR